MLKIDRIAIWIFIIFFALVIPSLVLVKFIDELMTFSMLGLAAADILVNRQWRRYRLLYILLGVMAFYIIYSCTWVHYNSLKAILTGAILELKPYIPLAILLSIAPKVTAAERRAMRFVALLNISFCLIALSSLTYFTTFIFGPIAIYGGVCILSAMVYLFASISPDGRFSRQHLIVGIAMLCLGLFCTRSKYYGEFVLSLFFLFIYKPGMLRHMTMSRIFLLSAILVLVIAVAYQKISFYFLDAIDINHIDLNKMDSYARMALYAMMFVVLGMHPAFGSGLASYASFASSKSYSSLYYKLGIDKVYGLSPSKPDFISDAYYPSLAQFGIVGIILYIWLWTYVYSFLRPLTRSDSTEDHTVFRIAAIIFCFIFIEMIAGTMVFMGPGELMVMLLALCCCYGKRRRLSAGETADHIITESKIPNRIR